MGRHAKRGLDYFNIDCVQEDNLTLVEAKHKIEGYGTVIKLWKKCYEIHGYYAEWDEKNIYLFAREIGVEVSFLKKVVETCFDECLFSKAMYNQYKILTSSGVQKRWKRIVTDAKRKEVEIEARFNLITEISEEIENNPDEKPKIPEEIKYNPSEMPQSKVKESKENKNKENRGAASPPPRSKKVGSKAKKTFIPPIPDQVFKYFLSTIGAQDHPRHWPEDKCRNQADLFFDHYETNGWVQKAGKPIKDWEAASRNWIRRELAGDFKPPEAPKRELQQGAAPRREMPSEPPPIEIELNQMYDIWRDNPEMVTVISATADHYNHLKSKGRIGFSEDEVKVIQGLVYRHMQDKQLQGDIAQKRLLKAYGVLEFFKQLKTQGKATVFEYGH